MKTVLRIEVCPGYHHRPMLTYISPWLLVPEPYQVGPETELPLDYRRGDAWEKWGKNLRFIGLPLDQSLEFNPRDRMRFLR